MHKPVFIFKKNCLGGGHEYKQYFDQVNWLTKNQKKPQKPNNQKPFAVMQSRQSKLISSISMCQKKLSSIIICQKKLWSLGFDKDSNRSQRENFQFIWRESIHHQVFNLALSIIPCFCGHTNKGSFTVCTCSNSRDL